MLLQFVVKNFLSFRDETVFKMTATVDDRHPQHVLEIPTHKIRVLKTAAIYGANASGKTNLLKAVRFLRSLVVKGTKPKEGIPVKRFKLAKQSSKEPSSFEIEILINDIVYSYGIAVDDRRVLEEWLFITKSTGRESKLFERITTENGEVKVEIGPQLLGPEQDKDFLSFVALGTRPEQPFLTEAESRNVKSIHPLMEWFREDLEILHGSAIYSHLTPRIHKDREFTKSLGVFLKLAGTGIERVDTDVTDLDFDKHFPGMSQETRREIMADLDGKVSVLIGPSKRSELTLITGTREKPKAVKIFTVHKTKDGNEVRFNFAEESAGTQRLIHLYPALFGLVASEKVFMVDELDLSLHPLLSRLFIKAFLAVEGVKSQLIFTTHEECLLDLDLLRRDEVWFIEKDKEHSSHAYPLTDFKIRPDLEIRKGYLKGRFGAIPFFQDISNLGWTTTE